MYISSPEITFPLNRLHSLPLILMLAIGRYSFIFNTTSPLSYALRALQRVCLCFICYFKTFKSFIGICERQRNTPYTSIF
ncbi:hypothetical protein CW304_29590 [Bacillus sp. UFRGS-B20]|nr:hypothetical protein CW304_29590 [Bacillus sp. UFRGS-B20]